MHITSATFIKGIVGTDAILEDGIPQVAFIGRSNVGKSSIINSLTKQKKLARTSSVPGRTQEINAYFINRSLYLLDLPGYGFAKISREKQEHIQKLIYWYLLRSDYEQRKIFLIIDANVGATRDDLDMLYSLEQRRKNVVVVANKVDKMGTVKRNQQLNNIQRSVGSFRVIAYSSKKKIGLQDLTHALLSQEIT